MSAPWYARTALTPFTVATAEQVNGELAKIEAALDQLPDPGAVGSGGTGQTTYTWYAYSDSADGTSNFTTGAPGSRNFVGIASNRVSPTESEFPEDYVWTRYRGADGTDGAAVVTIFLRSWSQPATPLGASPAGWSNITPDGPERLWFTTATKASDGSLLSSWSVPTSLSGPILRGAYAAAVTYYFDDLVTYGGGTYRSLGTTTGTAPSGTAEANAYWSVIAAPGAPGEPATPPSAFSATIYLVSSAQAVNLRTVADAAGYTGLSDATITFRVPNGVTIRGLPEGIGIDSGNWPSTSYGINLALVVESGAIVDGGGGIGGDGSFGGGQFGTAGGDAIYSRTVLPVIINAGGIVRAGGGGGRGGNSSITGFPEPIQRGGGGGGGGAPNGTGGQADYSDTGAPTAGANGTTGGGGAGGAGGGGGGASAGSAGGGYATIGGGVSPAAAGYAVRKNGNSFTVTNNGTMLGAAA